MFGRRRLSGEEGGEEGGEEATAESSEAEARMQDQWKGLNTSWGDAAVAGGVGAHEVAPGSSGGGGGDGASPGDDEAEAAARRELGIAFNRNIAGLMRCCRPDDMGNLFGCYRRTGMLFSMCRPTPRV